MLHVALPYTNLRLLEHRNLQDLRHGALLFTSTLGLAAADHSSYRPRRGSGRPQSVDLQSVQSNESSGWTAGISSLLGSNFPRRHDSAQNRLPVEMTTRHNKDQLPPTLSNQPDDPQEAEWNRFMLRLFQTRQENGEDISGGELIGASRFGQEGGAGRQKMERLTRLVIGGVPMNLRHAIWVELSGTQAIMQPDTYGYYLRLKESNDAVETNEVFEAEIDAILKDVPRTLTSKYDFYADKGYQRLKDLLVAFVAKYPDLGYTQGLNTIAGYLLLAIPIEEDAFWVLCNIVEHFFPPEYFSRAHAMVSPLADNILLWQYLKEFMPALSSHLERLEIRPDHTVPLKWFFTAFSSALPQTILMRMWDVWLCLSHQKDFCFAFALALISLNTDDIMACEEMDSYLEYMDSKLKVPEDAAQVDELIKHAFRISHRLGQVGDRRAEEVEKLKAGMHLENRLRRRKTDSLEVLVDREERPQHVSAEAENSGG